MCRKRLFDWHTVFTGTPVWSLCVQQTSQKLITVRTELLASTPRHAGRRCRLLLRRSRRQTAASTVRIALKLKLITTDVSACICKSSRQYLHVYVCIFYPGAAPLLSLHMTVQVPCMLAYAQSLTQEPSSVRAPCDFELGTRLRRPSKPGPVLASRLCLETCVTESGLENNASNVVPQHESLYQQHHDMICRV